jgi:hypothetical protein
LKPQGNPQPRNYANRMVLRQPYGIMNENFC